MKNMKLAPLFFLLPFFSFSQDRPFEIFGEISGDNHSKIYLFFEGHYKQIDSISCEIDNGKFYFKGKVTLPILAKLHMDRPSTIVDIYIDNSRTYLKCKTKTVFTNNGQDTLNVLSVVSVKGSATEKLKSDFEAWLVNLKKSEASDGEKREAYYQKLAAFIKKHPKNKVSMYLLGKASTLSYSQLKELNSLIDTSINKTFEAKTVKSQLNQLDKSKNYAVGVGFQDFVLRDSSGNEIDTKQFKGKYTLIVCWTSWCGPCRAEHPDLNVLYKKYKDKDFAIVGVSFDRDKQKWKQAIAKDQLLWPQLIDPNAFDGEMAKYYGIESVPASYLLDKDGKIVSVGLTAEEIEGMIKSILD